MLQDNPDQLTNIATSFWRGAEGCRWRKLARRPSAFGRHRDVPSIRYWSSEWWCVPAECGASGDGCHARCESAMWWCRSYLTPWIPEQSTRKWFSELKAVKRRHSFYLLFHTCLTLVSAERTLLIFRRLSKRWVVGSSCRHGSRGTFHLQTPSQPLRAFP